jgi:hypothetical protein
MPMTIMRSIRLNNIFEAGSAEKIRKAEESFTSNLSGLKDNCDCINSFNNELRVLLNKVAQAQHEAFLS